MQKLKDFIIEDDVIFHKNLEYSIEPDEDLIWQVYYKTACLGWFESLEQGIEYVLKQVEESSK